MSNENTLHNASRVAICLKVPPPLHDAVRSVATASHRSINAEINVALERHIRDAHNG